MPFPETADIATSSDDYARRFSGSTGEWFLDVQAHITLALIGAQPGATVLDVGGGHGQISRPLAEAGYRVTVLGSDESCRSRIDDLVADGKCTFTVGNVIDLPYEAGSFDVVTSFRLLPHCEMWPRLIKEMCRVTAGEVVVDYPAITGLNALAPMLFSAKKRIEKNTRTWRQFRHPEVTRAFDDNGFVRAGAQGQFFLPMVLHRALRCRTLSRFLEGGCGLLGLRSRWGSPVIARFTKK